MQKNDLEEILSSLPVARICTQFPGSSGPIKFQTNNTDTAGAALVFLLFFTWLCEKQTG